VPGTAPFTKKGESMFRAKYVPYLFLIPAMAGIFLFSFYPILKGAFNSLFTVSFITGSDIFVGLENYRSLFENPAFWKSLKVTLLFNVVVNPVQIILALLLALFLNKKLRGLNFFRTIHYIPITVSLPITCVLWAVLLNPDQGLANSLLDMVGLAKQPFLSSERQALWVIMGIATWKGVGYWSVFLLAGLQEVPKHLYEASAIDGAGRWQTFKNVTYPEMKRSILFVVIADTISNFLLFAPQYILTKGGPNFSTDVLMYETFNYAYVYSNSGLASALVVVLLFLMIAAVAVEYLIFRTKD
jgi:multiple sugar transport system permease protein